MIRLGILYGTFAPSRRSADRSIDAAIDGRSPVDESNTSRNPRNYRQYGTGISQWYLVYGIPYRYIIPAATCTRVAARAPFMTPTTTMYSKYSNCYMYDVEPYMYRTREARRKNFHQKIRLGTCSTLGQ